jgi:VCBS repeat-containing protein
MAVIDDDAVFDDQTTADGQTKDSSSEVLALAFGPAPAGRVVQSIARMNVVNNTTGESGFVYEIGVFKSSDPTNVPPALDQNIEVEYQRAFTIAVSPGDSISFSNYSIVGQVAFATLFADPIPIATDDSATILEDSIESVSGNVLGNDDHTVDGTGITVADPGTYQGQYGVLTINADGSYTYEANKDLLDTLTSNKQDMFLYTVSDGTNTDTGTLTIAINLAADNRTIKGTTGHDVLIGDADLIGAEDTIEGSSGNDNISGLAGADKLFGGSGHDAMFGGSGRDELYGESGNDILDAGAGNDLLVGGSGNDFMAGGTDADTFLFAKGNGYDTIKDFVVGLDSILLDGMTIKSLASKNVGGTGTLDLVVTLSAGGGTITLLDVGSGITAAQLLNPPPPPPVESFMI